MRTFFFAALLGAVSATPYGISEYIRAGIDNTASGPSHANNTKAPSNSSTSIPDEPCAVVAQALAKANPKKPMINATLAHACLQSVPLDAEGDRLQLDGLRTFVEFQSTLAYLKNPPPGFLYPPVDILAALDAISEKLENNGYHSEYDFQMDVSAIIGSAYDGHFTYKADITAIFTFLRLHALYSVSKDGLALPEVYLDVDFPMLGQRNASNYTVSPVAQINGQNVEAWMNSYATLNGGGQDPDSNYNAMFLTVPWGQDGFQGGLNYDGPYTLVTFRNGTNRIVEHAATTKANFTGVESGSDFFEKFCTGQASSSSEEESAPTPTSSSIPVIPTTEVPFQTVPSQTAEPGPSFFPVPYITMEDNSVAGYFPKENSDLAVLSISSFSPEPAGIEAYNQFANVVRTFLATSQKLGKKKLAIDLRGNGGGDVILGYDLFAQLFPNLTPYGATNFRATPLLNDVGTIVSDYYANITNVTASEPKDCNSDFSVQPFNFREELDVDNKPFTSWKDLYGPQEHNGDNFTNLMRYNLNDKFSIGCQNISNYGNITKITPQVFQPEDVILIQDGYCASTCAVFSEFMKSQAHVKQVVFGGRKQTGPMQAVGGVKGANVYAFDALISWIDEAATNLSTPTQKQMFDKKYGNITEPAMQLLTRAAVGPDGLAASANTRNNIRLDDNTVTPLQFIYEAADCRLFYTAPMLRIQSLVWSAAYNSAFQNGACVAGSTDHPSSKPGCDVASNMPPPNARNFFGSQILSVFPEGLSDRSIGMGEVQDKRKKPKFHSHGDKNETQENAAMGVGGKRGGAVLGSLVVCAVVAGLL